MARLPRKGARTGHLPHHRLNSHDGLEVEMDEWKPKSSDCDTIAKMGQAFDTWKESPGAQGTLESLAKRLVSLRRERAAADGAK